MTPPAALSLTADLQAHLALCQEVFELVLRESEALRETDAFAVMNCKKQPGYWKQRLE